MVMNVDSSNHHTKIDNNALKSQQYILEGISFSIVLSGKQTEGKYALDRRLTFLQILKTRYLSTLTVLRIC